MNGRTRQASRLPMFAVLACTAIACERQSPNPSPAPRETAASPGPVAIEAPAPAAQVAPATGPFSVHEWGLVAVDMAHAELAEAASGTLHPLPSPAPIGLGNLGLGIGMGGYGGKPVLYVHLDEGVDEATFALSLALGRANVPEHFPPAALDDAQLRFAPIIARRGACSTTNETAPPAGRSAACAASPDHFCEAAEIPRYHGDDDTCLEVGASHTELLFYRASHLDTAPLPLMLAEREGTYYVGQRANEPVLGPVYFVERRHGGAVRIRPLDATERAGAVPLEGVNVTPTEARTALLAHARSLGLRETEADAFIDAWAPAFFDHCHRHGPEAHGSPPAALRQVDASLLYFAPRPVVDAMLPLATDPPARATARAFLVRVVDASRPTPAPPAPMPATPIRGLASAAALRATVSLGRPVVRGGVSTDAIRRVVQRNLSQLTHCYEMGLTRNPYLEGRFTIEVVIAPAGNVQASIVVDSALPDPTTGDCSARAFRRWAFPASDSERSTMFRMPITLALTE